MLQLNIDDRPLICGVGLGGYWAERIGFLCDIRQVVFNPNLFPNENMEGKIDRPEEYVDIATKCVSNFREKNRDRCLVILSRNDEALNSHRAAELLHHYYEIVWDEEQTHKFKNISPHLQRIKAFKTLAKPPRTTCQPGRESAPGFLFVQNCLLLSHQNLMHINFGMTNAPDVVFSIHLNGFSAVTCC